MNIKNILHGLILISIAFSAKSQNSGNQFFSSSQIHTIKITSSLSIDQFYDSLSYYKDQASLTNDNTYIKVDVDIDGTTIQDIGIRMKGNSSYNTESKKKSLKLSFDEYIDDQEYDGMGTLNLNNSMWDPTLMREKVTLDFMNEIGVYAPRCTYANVYLNNILWGLYSTVEQIDKKYLNTRIGENDGNLFKSGDDGGEFTWYGNNQNDYENYFKLKTNDSLNDWSDLINLIDVINNTAPLNYSSTLETVFNSNSFIKYWAVCNLLTNLDSYLESTRNFYIYHNLLTDKFDWIAWDVNESFGVFSSMNYPNTFEYPLDASVGRVLIDKLINIATYKDQYTDYLYNLNSNYVGTNWLNNKIDSIYSIIKPSVYADTLKMFTNQNFEDNVDTTVTATDMFSKNIPGLKEFINKRFINMNQQLMAIGYPSAIHEQIMDDAIFVFPNPSTDYIIIYQNEKTNIENYLEIYDITGQKVLSHFLTNNIEYLNINFLHTGLYSYKIDNTNKILKTGTLLLKPN